MDTYKELYILKRTSLNMEVLNIVSKFTIKANKQ